MLGLVAREHLFFGRDRDQLVELFHTETTLTVLGPSGAGKSSLPHHRAATAATWDLSAFGLKYQQLKDQVHRTVPVVWERGGPVLEKAAQFKE